METSRFLPRLHASIFLAVNGRLQLQRERIPPVQVGPRSATTRLFLRLGLVRNQSGVHLPREPTQEHRHHARPDAASVYSLGNIRWLPSEQAHNSNEALLPSDSDSHGWLSQCSQVDSSKCLAVLFE